MRDVKTGHAGLLEDAAQLVAQADAQLGVEVGERFVEQQELRSVDEAARQRDALQAGAEKRVAELEAAVAKRDAELKKRAKLEQQRRKEMRQLCLMQRREGVNMEYLKNVVVQYMSFRPAAWTSEQKTLVPVLYQMLSFTDDDKAAAEEMERGAGS